MIPPSPVLMDVPQHLLEEGIWFGFRFGESAVYRVMIRKLPTFGAVFPGEWLVGAFMKIILKTFQAVPSSLGSRTITDGTASLQVRSCSLVFPLSLPLKLRNSFPRKRGPGIEKYARIPFVRARRFWSGRVRESGQMGPGKG